VRLAKSAGGVIGVLLLVGVVFLLTRGKPKPAPHPKAGPAPVAATASAGVQDAFTFAKSLQSRLAAEPRYSRLYLVPSAATANQTRGKVVVMGEIASEDELRDLHAFVAKDGIPITLEWNVSIASPPAASK
jgi:hypothetical protein